MKTAELFSTGQSQAVKLVERNLWFEGEEDLTPHPRLAAEPPLADLAQVHLAELVANNVWIEEEEQLTVRPSTVSTDLTRQPHGHTDD